MMAGVPVGDTTLLAGLRQTAADHEDGMGLLTAQFTQLVDALPAVVTLIEAAHDLDTWLQNTGFWVDDDHAFLAAARAFSAALAPFVGEATQ